MKNLFEKLNYKGQKRIAVINAAEDFILLLNNEVKDILVDTEIDQRFPYDFILVFVKSVSEVEFYSPLVLHNLVADGILWLCYPKKSSKKYKTDIDRDHGWKSLNDSGLHGIRIVSVDDDWSALRFRNARFIKSVNKRFSIK